MGQQFLIDLNAVVDYLDGKLPGNGMAFMSNVIDDFTNIAKLELLNPWKIK